LIDLNVVMYKAVKHLNTSIKDRNAKVQVQNLPILKSNDFFRNYFKDLIENGLKFNNRSSPEIIISSQIKGNQKQVLISIRDNGISLAAEFQEQIFEMFKRLPT